MALYAFQLFGCEAAFISYTHIGVCCLDHFFHTKSSNQTTWQTSYHGFYALCGFTNNIVCGQMMQIHSPQPHDDAMFVLGVVLHMSTRQLPVEMELTAHILGDGDGKQITFHVTIVELCHGQHIGGMSGSENADKWWRFANILCGWNVSGPQSCAFLRKQIKPCYNFKYSIWWQEDLLNVLDGKQCAIQMLMTIGICCKKINAKNIIFIFSHYCIRIYEIY